MRTLAVFVAVCLILAGVVAFWMFPGLAGNESYGPPPSTPETSPPPPSSHSAPQPDPIPTPVVQPSTETTEEVAPVISSPEQQAIQTSPPQPTSGPIVWVDDVRRKDAVTKFRELRAIIAEDPHNEPAIAAALDLARENQWPNEVCDLLTRLVRLRPDDSARRFELATQLMLLERWVEAIPHLRELADLHPDDARILYNLAVSHQAVGRLHDARRAWDRVIELAPDNPEALARRGEVLLDLRKWAAAAADFQGVLDLEPESLDAAMNLSLALSKTGGVDEARELLASFLAKNPRHVPLLNRLAELTWMAYESVPARDAALASEVRSYCERSLAIVPDQPDVRELLERAARR